MELKSDVRENVVAISPPYSKFMSIKMYVDRAKQKALRRNKFYPHQKYPWNKIQKWLYPELRLRPGFLKANCD